MNLPLAQGGTSCILMNFRLKLNELANKFIVFSYEFLGTTLLIYAINLQMGEIFGVAGIGFMLFALLLIGGPITGAHFNPAVTLGVYMSN